MREHDGRHSRSDAADLGRGEGRGAGVGKQTLVEAYAAPVPTPQGRGEGHSAPAKPASSSAKAAPAVPARNADGSLPRLNLYAAKAKADREDDGDDGGADAKAAKPAEAADAKPADATPADAAQASEGEPGASGWGIGETVRRAGQAVTSAVGAIAGVPVVTHETMDTAPGAAGDRTTVGVGEMITFRSNMPGRWRADRGARAFPRRATGDQFLWAAMSTRGAAKITFDPTEAGKPNVEITINVIAPTVDYLNPRAATFPGQGPGNAGVLMDTDVTFGPNTVSFANTMWLERGGPATGASGYFRDHVRVRRRRLPYHRPNPNPEQIDENNSGITDSAGWWDFNGPFSDGAFEWVIPTYYKVVDDSARHLITNVHQRCTIAANGTMTVTKGSATLSRTP